MGFMIDLPRVDGEPIEIHDYEISKGKKWGNILSHIHWLAEFLEVNHL